MAYRILARIIRPILYSKYDFTAIFSRVHSGYYTLDWIRVWCIVSTHTHSGMDWILLSFTTVPVPTSGFEISQLFINVRKFLRQIAFRIFINGENLR